MSQDLLDAQADVNQEMTMNLVPLTPLLLAIQMQDVSLTRRLIAAGADLKWQPREKGYALTILQSAVRTGNKQIVKVLLDARADVNHPASPPVDRLHCSLRQRKRPTSGHAANMQPSKDTSE